MTDWSPSRSVLLVTIALLVVASLTAVGTSVASPQPTPICPNCGESFERAASEQGYEVNITRSVVDVQVRADGSARWTTRTTLSESSASNLTTSATRDVVTSRLDRHRLGTPQSVTVEREGRTVVVSYTLTDIATTRTGVLLVDAFYQEYRTWWIVNADRFTIHAPEGYRLANDLPAETTDTTATYHGSSEDRLSGDSLDSSTLIAFTSAGTTLPSARADAAIAAYLLPAALTDLLHIGAIPALVLAGAVLLYNRYDIEHAGPDLDADQLSTLTIGVVAILLGIPIALGNVWFGLESSNIVLATGFGLLAAALAARHPERATLTGLVVATAAGLLAFAASNLLVSTMTTRAPLEQAIDATLFAVLLATPLVATLPLGFADATQDHRARYLRIAIVAAPLVLLATRVPIRGGFGGGLLTLLLIVFSLSVAIMGALPYWVGARLGTEQRR